MFEQPHVILGLCDLRLTFHMFSWSSFFRFQTWIRGLSLSWQRNSIMSLIYWNVLMLISFVQIKFKHDKGPWSDCYIYSKIVQPSDKKNLSTQFIIEFTVFQKTLNNKHLVLGFLREIWWTENIFKKIEPMTKTKTKELVKDKRLPKNDQNGLSSWEDFKTMFWLVWVLKYDRISHFTCNPDTDF